ncbi:WbqC family protein [Pusillimonas sp. DMV24BSW_D]|uniref:WbqC family protein n=1 Tax=Neopusillimonas aestuarii TaxID=2716226 RepID=UPI00140D0A18|nr:WbqC family protein [Pusillimonas sp. DMV24BSW_D]QIM48066.1 WbqC family protein [Pusillimonas sp. DMV24BSW_D]
MKRIAIIQSNYLPWRGYFDMIAYVDEFIIYDDMQFTKNDWRNRNKIKTPQGEKWISIPVGQNINRRIRDVELTDTSWQRKHWQSMELNYRRAPFFPDIAALLKPVYIDQKHLTLSSLNRKLIEVVCSYLEIRTIISNSWDYTLTNGKTERLIDLCTQTGATEYVSGPAAKDYLDQKAFAENNIQLTWFDYTGYPEYPQLWGDYTPSVSIIDLLFNCGKRAAFYMKFAPRNLANLK